MLPPLLTHRCRGVASALIFVSLCASAASKPSTAPVKPSGGKHCLWRVTNAKAPFYLLGSIHRLRSGDYPLPTVIEQAVHQSQQFYFEYDPKRDDDFEKKLIAAAKLPHGVTLKEKVHAKTWDYLRRGAQGGGTDWVNLKPWAVAMFLLDYPMQERLSSAFGLDNYVLKKARQRSRPLHGLESVDDHVNVFAGMNDIESEAYLLEAIVYANQNDARAREMISAWKTGSTERLFALEMPSLTDAPGLNPRFLEQRNVRWIPVIEKAIKTGEPTMIVAGAMHFSGPHSVLNMLRAQGYQIEQL
jgi:uncharacterized protein YbaP (TraB family)